MKYLLMLVLIGFQISLFAQEPHPISGINMKRNSKWPAQSSGKTVIEVSWDNPSSSDAQQREWVRNAIESTWEKYANIDFVGWGRSNVTSKGIRINIEPYGHPHTKGLGSTLDGMTAGMVLNFDFLGKFKCSGLSQEDCIKFIAVHEFGHALGFAHEHNRFDCLCNEVPQGTDGDFYVTPCDLQSVMNYCNPKWSNYGKLSTNDIVGAQVIYGKPKGGSGTVDLNEIRIIPCSPDLKDRVLNMKTVIKGSSSFKVSTFSEETKPVQQKAVDNLSNIITIRFFDLSDESKAYSLKKLLANQGYNNNSIAVENMITKMGSLLPNYIEIWTKEQSTPANNLAIDEIRFIPCTVTATDSIKTIKKIISEAQNIKVKNYTEESKAVPQKVLNKLTNKITIRYFDANDEIKAIAIKKILTNGGYNILTIVIENMIPKMSKLYPGYIEIWSK